MDRTTLFFHTDFLDSQCELFSLFWQIVLPLEAKEVLTSHDPLQTLPWGMAPPLECSLGMQWVPCLLKAQSCVLITDPWNKQRHIFPFQHHDDVTERRGRQGPHSGKHRHDEIVLPHALGLSLINIKSQVTEVVMWLPQFVQHQVLSSLESMQGRKSLWGKELGNHTAQYQPNQNRSQKSLILLLWFSNYQTFLQWISNAAHSRAGTAHRRVGYCSLSLCVHPWHFMDLWTLTPETGIVLALP